MSRPWDETRHASAPGGRVYRRRVRVCTTCDARLDTTAARRACDSAGHQIEVREQRIWWIKYYAEGRVHCVSSHSADRQVADDLLKVRDGHVGPDRPGTAPAGPVTFHDAAEDTPPPRPSLTARNWM